MYTRRVGKIRDSKQSQDIAEGLHNFPEFSHPSECLDEAM